MFWIGIFFGATRKIIILIIASTNIKAEFLVQLASAQYPVARTLHMISERKRLGRCFASLRRAALILSPIRAFRTDSSFAMIEESFLAKKL